MTKLYIAGPMTGYKEYNRPAFFKADKVLKELGMEPVNPAAVDGPDPKASGGPWAEYLKRNIPLMLKCQGIVLLEGWRRSKGASLEAKIAKDLGLQMFELHEDGLCGLQEENPAVEAMHIVGGDRQLAYGHPANDFTRTAQIWTAILGHPVTARQVSLCMVGLKISREVNQHKRDNIVDGIGYWLTLGMVCDREETERRIREIEKA